MNTPRVLVVQNGARHNYAVPNVLAEAGWLEAFYTDACGNAGLGQLASVARHVPMVGGRLNRLNHRTLPAAVLARAKTFPASMLIDSAANRCSAGRWGNRCLDGQLRSAGLGNATLVYSSLGWGRALLTEARRRNIPVVSEFYLRPSLWKTYQDEFRSYPGWEAELPLQGLEGGVGTSRDPCTVSDFVIVPAEGVAEDVATTHGFARERILVVPYGVDDTFFQLQNRPVAGRVLFAGTACLGKGIHILAFAAERLAALGKRYEFRVAGSVSPLIRTQHVCKHLTFLGRIPRSDFWREYESADILAIPSLSEGFSSVGLEALAAGVPVVATEAAGTVVRDGIDGRVISERDPVALADAISSIVDDRPLRERMAQAARGNARNYTWHRYGERLMVALQKFGSLPR